MADDAEPNEELRLLVEGLTEKLTDAARNIGLYLEHAGIASKAEPDGSQVLDTQEFREHVDKGDVMIVGVFAIGDVAWEKRTLNPEQDEIDKQAREMLPDPVELLRERIRRAHELGLDPLDEEEEENG